MPGEHTRETSTASTTLTPTNLPHADAGPTILTVLWVLTTIPALFLALRLYCKFKTHRGLWWDDHILLGSWVCLLVFTSLNTHAVVHLHYGAPAWDFPPENLRPLSILKAASRPFWGTSIIWSKTSFGVSLLRITDGWMKQTVWFWIIGTNIFLGFSVLISYIRCRPIQASWDPEVKGVCWDDDGVKKYYMFSAAYSAAADFALALLAWKIVWGLQMRTKEKVGVGIAMSMGVFAGVASIMKAYRLQWWAGGLYYAILILYWGTAETATTIVAASIPVIRVLIQQVRSSAKQYDRTDNEAGYRRESLNRVVTIRARNQSQGDDQSDECVLNEATGGVHITQEISVNYVDYEDQDSLGGCEMDVLSH